MAERHRHRGALLLVIGLLTAGTAFAATTTDPQALPWSQLTPAQQQALADSHEHWNKLPPERQHRLAKGAARWQQMTPEQRRKAQANAQRWKSMSPQQQSQVRDSYQQFHSLPPDQRQQLRAQYQHFHSLPPDQRQHVRDCLHRRKHGDTVSCDNPALRSSASTAGGGAPATRPDSLAAGTLEQH